MSQSSIILLKMIPCISASLMSLTLPSIPMTRFHKITDATGVHPTSVPPSMTLRLDESGDLKDSERSSPLDCSSLSSFTENKIVWIFNKITC